METFLLSLELCSGEPSVGLRHLILEIFLPIFICHTWVWDQPVPHLHSSYQSWCGFFFNSIVVGLPFSSVSDGSKWWLFSSCNFDVVVQGRELCGDIFLIFMQRHFLNALRQTGRNIHVREKHWLVASCTLLDQGLYTPKTGIDPAT